jgi:hypothetical protein
LSGENGENGEKKIKGGKDRYRYKAQQKVPWVLANGSERHLLGPSHMIFR